MIVVVMLASCAAPEDRPITDNQEPLVTLALPKEARAGEPVSFTGTARDLDGKLVALRLEPGDESPIDVDVSDPRGTFTIASPGIATIALVATDDAGLEGRARVPLLVSPGRAPPPPDDTGEGEGDVDPVGEGEGEGDAIGDGGDERGMHCDVFTVSEPFPRDWLGRQKAEDVVEDLAEATPAASFDAASGWAAMDPATDPLSAHIDGAPDVSALFVLRFTGVLVPPVGAASVIVDVAADDIGVVSLDGAVVASADDEYATSPFRSERVPAESEPHALFGPADLAIVVGSDEGAYAWSVRLRFLAEDGTVIAEPASFVLPSE